MPEEMKPGEQPAGQQPPAAPAQAPQAKQPAPAPAVDNKKLMAALSYLGILFLIPLLTDAKNDENVKFHIRQGIVLFIIDVFASFIVWIPFIGQAVGLVLLIVSVYGFVQAYQGIRWEMPVVGQYAKQIKI